MPETVVLLHGVLMNGRELAVLARRLRRDGFTPRVFDYPSRRRDVRENARELVRFLERMKLRPVHLVGHSLGGLVILEALRQQPGLPPGRVVLLGSPIQGSQVARQLYRFAWGRWLLGRSGEGGLLVKSPDPAGAGQIGVISGCRPVGVGRLLCGLSGVHDGTVTLAETRLDGVEDAVVVNTTHTGLVFSRPVADQVCRFLRSGRFNHVDGAGPAGTGARPL